MSIKQSGISLIEMIIFIVVVSIAVTGVLLAFTNTQRTGQPPIEITTATQLAQERMELILTQKRLVGFATFTDPCPGLGAICNAPTGYQPLVVTIAGAPPDPVNFKLITVTVRNAAGSQLTQLQTLTANY